jgi:ATP-dependent RNA helicase DeaD
VAERRVTQFKQQILDVIAEENLDFFYEVVRRMETEESVATRQIAAALAFLAQRERPLRPDGMEDPVSSPRTESPYAVPPRGASSRAVPPAPTFDRPERTERYERSESAERKPRAEAPKRAFSPSGVTIRYRIEVGKNQGALPKEIVGAIANEGGIDGKLIGQINLFDDYSTVELPELPNDLLETLKRTRVRQMPLRIRPAAPGEGEKTFTRRPRADDAPRARRPANADFSARPKREFSDAGSGGNKPPYRSDKKPAAGTKPPFAKRKER